MRRGALTALLSVALLACSTGAEPEKRLLKIPGVPPFAEQQSGDDCAAVALASLLAHAGRDIAPVVIDRQVYDPVLRGSLLADLENYLVEEGLTPRTGRGSLNLLRTRLAAGTPVLLPIDLGFALWRRPHYVLVYGTVGQDFLLHMRAGESHQLPASELDSRWEKMGRLYLYLDPERS